MKRNLLTLVSSLTLLLCATSSLFAQDNNPPENMTFQGFLTDDSGVPYGNTAPVNQEITFKIYAAPTGNATHLWGESQVVTIDKGHFSVLLGLGSAVGAKPPLYDVFTGVDASSRWMELTVGTKVISPRIQFFAAPYAQLARVANELASDTGDITSTGTIQTTGNIVAGDVIASGEITGASMDLGTGTINSGTFTSSGNITGKAITGTSLKATNGTFQNQLTANRLSTFGTIKSEVGRIEAAAGFFVGNSKAYLYDNHLRDVKEMWNNQGDKKMSINGSLTVNRDGNVTFLDKVGINLGDNSPKVSLQVDAERPRIWSGDIYVSGNDASFGQYLGQFQAGVLKPTGNVGVSNNYTVKYNYLAALFNGGVIVRDHIWATTAAISSDARAKTIHGVSDAAHDLDTLRKIKIQDFHWTDRTVDGFRPHKLTIAQQVEEVFPEAVMISPAPKAIPNIYSMASSVNHHAGRGELVLTLDKNHDLTEGDSVDLFSKGKEMKEFNVTRVLNEKTFAVASEQSLEEVFVYGKYVNDFRSVDYDAIAMLNVSATQELARKSEASVLETEKLKSRIRDLEARERRVAQLEKSLEAKLSRIELVEKRLDALDRRLVSVAPQIDRNSEGLQVSVRAGSSQ